MIKLSYVNGTYDLTLTPNVTTDAGLRTTVLVSLLTDAASGGQRGYWADKFLQTAGGDAWGSLLWTLGREKQTVETARRAEVYVRQALQHLIDDGVASTVTAAATWLRRGVLLVDVTIEKGSTELYREAWEMTLGL